MYRQQPRRPYPAYGTYGQYAQYAPRAQYVPRAYGQQYQPRPYGGAAPAANVSQHPYLTQAGVQNKFWFGEVDRLVLDVCHRHPRRQVGADLLKMKCLYADKSQEELNIPLDVHIPFNLKSTETCLVPEPVATKPHDKDKTRYFAKVMILSGAGPEDEKLKGKVHFTKRLNFLLSRKEHGAMTAIGGEWSAEKDGATPTDANLKKTAIRVTKALTGVDLSPCSQWLKFVEFHYTKEEGKQCTVYFVPNVWEHFQEGIEPYTQVREEEKEVKEEVEEEEEDPEDPEKKKKVKKQVTVTKKVKIVEWKPHEMTLHGLLEYDCSRSNIEELSELCVFADCFHEMIQRDYGLKVISILQKKAEENEALENEKKRKREEDEAAAAEKKAKTEDGEAAKEEEKKEEAKEEKKEEAPKPKTKLQHTVDQEILLPFQYFDRQPHSGIITGSLRRDVLEGTMHQYGTMTKREIDDLLQKGANLRASTGVANSPLSVLYYVKLATTTTEVPVEEEKEEEKKEAPAEGEKAKESTEDSQMEDAEAEAEAGESAAAEPTDGPQTEASLNKLLLKDLRTMCAEKELSTAGKKADLVERLLKAQ